MRKIDTSDIVAFAPFCEAFPIETDPIYGGASHPENHFGQIYHPEATVWGHRDMVKVVLLAAKRLQAKNGWTLVIKDCLRPVEAQTMIGDAPISKANPHWFQEPRFMSPPGMGGHPRGMAVDLAPKNIDMGTVVDDLSERAGRNYTGFSDEVLENRKILEDAMVKAGSDFGIHIHPLSNEWWDFRFLPEIYNAFEPLSDKDLLPHQKMITRSDKIYLKQDEFILKDLSRFVK